MMSRRVKLLNYRYEFSVFSARDEQNWNAIEALYSINSNPFDRCEDHGHITASALVVDRECRHMLMVHHVKLGMWLPPGGHCDSDNEVSRVCRREVFEETGCQHLEPLTDDVFDIDIHVIPEWKRNRRHLHYDVRFAFKADMSQPLVISAESKDLRWVPIKDVGSYTDMPSVLILKEKLEDYKS
jgi:8-oxo-dGTP pyrophosphatase MutT (NUDIX family)